MLSETFATALTLIICGQISLSVPLLVIRSVNMLSCLPLAIFLFATGVLALQPLVANQFPTWSVIYIALAFPVLFLLAPCLWLYIDAQTSFQHWRFHRKHLKQFALLLPAIIISLMILMLPEKQFIALFVDETDVTEPFAITVAVSILIIILLWLGQCSLTIISIIKRLVYYRRQLKDLFSNKEDKELSWINWLLPLIALTWVYLLSATLFSNIFDNLLFSANIEALLALLLIWSLAHFGLQQKPVTLVSLEDDDEPAQPNDKSLESEDNETQKYQRSALSIEQANRIAVKIQSVMEQDKLYLDASLSLQKLSSYLAISPNYISQTLNETLNNNFFDFVNHWRIKAAKPLIVENQDTILNIALSVGFNARSSFYKAFKQETGQTPSEYRKQQKS